VQWTIPRLHCGFHVTWSNAIPPAHGCLRGHNPRRAVSMCTVNRTSHRCLVLAADFLHGFESQYTPGLLMNAAHSALQLEGGKPWDESSRSESVSEAPVDQAEMPGFCARSDGVLLFLCLTVPDKPKGNEQASSRNLQEGHGEKQPYCTTAKK
jgi:hypothetical protein